MRVAALLRGINIGPHRRISMAELRAVVAALGHGEVETYLQSGNVVLAPAGGIGGAALEAQLAAAIREATGFDVGVIARSGAELTAIVAASPFAVDDPTRLVVAFFDEPLGADALGLGPAETYAPDRIAFAADGRHAYADVPNGQAESKLMATLTRRSRDHVVTVRNWRTVTALADLTR
jgi:uncharacterized protein (DUF1697 family)